MRPGITSLLSVGNTPKWALFLSSQSTFTPNLLRCNHAMNDVFERAKENLLSVTM